MVTDNHYRWDFIGLSTDAKPTPSTSSKVSDGSTFYCSDNSKLYVWYKNQWYERTAGGGASYTAGDGIVIENDEISADLAQTTGESTTKLMSQKAITDALASAGGDIKTLSTDDYNYPTNSPNRVALWLLPNGLYRIPTSGVSVYYAYNSVWTAGRGDFVIIEKYQAGAKPISMYFFGGTDGVNYCEVSTSGSLNRDFAYTILSDRVSQSTGNDQYSVMSQNAVTSMIYHDPTIRNRIKIGNGASDNIADNGVEIGHDTSALATGGLAIGNTARVNSGATDGIAINFSSVSGSGSIGIGYDTSTSAERSVAIGRSAQTSAYRTIAVGAGAKASSARAIAIGDGALASQSNAIALGGGSNASHVGEMNIGVPNLTGAGYNNSDYRLLTGLYDAQNAHDAVTLGQLNTRLGNLTITTISQTDYDNLSTKDPDTLYIITGA